MERLISIICACIMCGCACTNGNMQEKKENCQKTYEQSDANCKKKDKKADCQKICDSLTVVQTLIWKVEKVEPANWNDKKRSTVIVGTVPVPMTTSQKMSGSILFMNNGQKILTTYVNVPVGTLLVQKPIYEPKRIKKSYVPKVVEYEHYLWVDNTAYELKNFKLI